MCHLSPVNVENFPAYRSACSGQRLFGSRNLCAHAAGTAESCLLTGPVPVALSLCGNVLTLVSHGQPPTDELIPFITAHSEIREIDSTLSLCAALQKKLGGELDSSFFMRCDAPDFPPKDPALELVADPPPEAVFSILQRSHHYYETHLQFGPWSAELSKWLELGLSELYGWKLDGTWIGTGRLISHDDAAGVVGAIAVLPEYRGRGYGSQITSFLTKRVLDQGRTPILMTGYDAVAALYQKVGFIQTSRWGQLYLSSAAE